MITRYQSEFNLYIRLELSGTLHCPARWTGIRHKHAFWEIIYIHQGKGRYVFGEKILDVSAGQAVLIRPMTDHQMLNGDKNTIMSYIGFRTEIDPWLWEKYGVEGELPLHQIEGSGELKTILKEMAEAADFQPLGPRTVRALIPVMAWMKALVEQRDDADNQKNKLCMMTVKYLRSSMDRFVTVNEIAASLYVTPHYLGLVFSARMGQTILKYQQALKMERASALIRENSMSLTDISCQLGFSSPQYFSKCFKAYYGFPPNQLKSKADGAPVSKPPVPDPRKE